jgi:hypothetical protein
MRKEIKQATKEVLGYFAVVAAFGLVGSGAIYLTSKIMRVSPLVLIVAALVVLIIYAIKLRSDLLRQPPK